MADQIVQTIVRKHYGASEDLDPGKVEAVTEAACALLDNGGFDADAPITVNPETLTATTHVRDADGLVYELTLRPVSRGIPDF